MGYKLKEIIFPPKCILCRTLLKDDIEGYLCDKCHHLVLRHHVCPKCGRPYQISQDACVYCKGVENNHDEQIRALFPYKDQYRKSVLRWKYKGIRKYAKAYADLFVNDLGLLETFQIDGLVPVPLSPARQRKRGFNQALDLCHEISHLTQIPVYDILRRNKNTKPQSQCDKKERLTHLRGTIEVKTQKDSLTLRNIAIIDDIYTTGATINECIAAVNRQNKIAYNKLYILIVCIGV